MESKKNIIKGRMGAALKISFIWFSTQFGGGFGSGAQLKSYFVSYGVWCFLTCIGAEAICAVYNCYIAYYSKKHGTYDHRSFNESFFGRYSPIYSNLYEMVYIFTMLVVPAVAFVTGGTTLSSLTGLSYPVCAIMIGTVIFLASAFGGRTVRIIETVVSVFIIAVVGAFFLPTILSHWDNVSLGVAVLSEGRKPFLPAFWSMIIYAAFQIASSPAIHSQHSEVLRKPEDAVFSYIIAFILNCAVTFILVLGVVATAGDPEFEKTSVPFVLLMRGAKDSAKLTAMVSILIVLGSVSTAINMVSAASVRICRSSVKGEKRGTGSTLKKVLVPLGFSVLGFIVATVGLLPIIQKGYSIMAYITLPTIMVPYIVQAAYTKCDRKSRSPFYRTDEITQ